MLQRMNLVASSIFGLIHNEGVNSTFEGQEYALLQVFGSLTAKDAHRAGKHYIVKGHIVDQMKMRYY